MGVQTEFLGQVEVSPALNESEVRFLHAFARSRRWRRPEGPYAIGSPDDDLGRGDEDLDLYNRPPEGQPSLWCDWEACPAGCCIGWNGMEKFYGAMDWLVYLIDHFVRPGAVAQTSGDPRFADFTFDHQVEGLIVGEQRDNRELFVMRVQDNEVDATVLRAGDPNPYGEWRSWARHLPLERWDPPWALPRRRIDQVDPAVVELARRPRRRSRRADRNVAVPPADPG